MANKAPSKLGWHRFSGSHSRVAVLLVFAMLVPALALILTTTQGEVVLASPDTFPVVAAVNGGNNTTASTEHTVNLPADIDAGDLLLVFFASDGAETLTFPEGWTELFQTVNGTTCTLGAAYRIADGEEGATITVTTSSLETSAHTSYRITGYSGTPEVGTSVTGADANPNPPSLSPSWGAKDTLWFAVEGNDRDRNVTDYPADYTDGRNDRAVISGGCSVGSARRELNAASEDPGAFTINAADEWVANTVAIQPSAAPGTFGYDTIGGSSVSIDSYMRGSVFTVPSAGTADNITAYIYDDAETSKQCAIYKHSDNTLLTNGTTEIKEDLVINDWLTFTFSTPPTLEADTEYVLEIRAEDAVLLYYDAGDTDQGHYEDGGLSSFPSPTATFTHDNNEYSIYCSYTPPSLPVLPTQPTLYLPSDGSALYDDTPYFEWTKGESADNHRLLVWITDNNDYVENRVLTTDNYTIAEENALSLTRDNYSWKVVAQNENGDNESATWTFLNHLTPVVIWSYHDPSGYAVDVAMSTDGKYMAGGTELTDTLYFWDNADNVPEWSYNLGDDVKDLDMSDNGRYIAVAYAGGIKLFENTDNTVIWSFNTGGMPYVAVSADATRIVGSEGGDVWLWDNADNNYVWTYKQGAYSRGARASADGNYVIAIFENYIIKFTDNDNTPVWKYKTPYGVWKAESAISDNGSYCVVAVGAGYQEGDEVDWGYLYLFGSDNNPIWSYNLTAMPNTPYGLDITSSGHRIVGGTAAGAGINTTIEVFNNQDNIPIFSENLETPCWSADIHDSGQYFAAGSGKFSPTEIGHFWFFSVEENKLYNKYDLESLGWDLEITDDCGKSFASSDHTRKFFYFELDLFHPYMPTLVSPDNNAELTDNTPTFDWIPGAGGTSHRLLIDNDNDFSSPNENRIFVADDDYTIPDENSLPYDNYTWKVVAISIIGENESAVRYFELRSRQWDLIENWTGTIIAPTAVPVVENLYITDMDNVATDNLAPQVQYKFWVEISDNETLADIENVTLVVYLDNENLADNEVNHYTFRWTRDGGFDEVGPGGTAEETGIVVDNNLGRWTDARLPSQHKIFFVQDNYWIFYHEDSGDDVVYRTSNDGENWSSRIDIGDALWSAYFSVWLDDEDNFHVTSQYSAAYDLLYRKGTPQSDGTINWLAGWQTVLDSSAIEGDAHVIVDDNGYPWIGYIANDYDPEVIKSDNKDGTWQTSSGFPHTLHDYTGGDRYCAVPVPLANGQVYVVYGGWESSDTNEYLRGKLWDGDSWGDNENVSTSLTYKYFSMWGASGMDNDVHVAMFTKSQTIVYIERIWGSGWENEENIKTTGLANDYSSPTLTLDKDRGEIWLFWSDDNIVKYRRNVGGIWGNEVEWIDENVDNFQLNRGYTMCSAEKTYDNKVLTYYVTSTSGSTPYQLKFSYIDLNVSEHLITDNCVAGDNTKTVDNFIFAIEFGADATVTDADNWDVWVQVYDSYGNEDNRFFLNQFDIVSLVQEYSRPIEQGFSLMESAPRGAEFGRMIEQGFSFGAAVTIVMEVCRLLSQAFGFAGTVGVTSEWRKSLTQDFSLTGSVEANREFDRSVAQGFSLTDAVSANMEREGAIDQSFSLADVVGVNKEISKSIAKDFSFTDEVEAVVERFTQEYERPIEQDFSLNGSVEANRELGRSVAQGFSLTDAVSANMEREGAIDQSFSLADVVGVNKEISKSIAKDFSFTDEVEAVVERFTQEYERPIEQDFSLNGSVEANRELGRGIAQGFSLTESIAVGKEIAIDLSDAFSLSATVTAPASFVRGLGGNWSFTATVETQYRYVRTIAQEFSVSATVGIEIERLAREYERSIEQGFSIVGTVIAHEYGDIYVTSPWCDGRANPIDVVVDPTFSVIYTVIDNNIPNPAQFIQIQVGTSLNDNDLWDNISAVTVENGQRSLNVSYDGMPLTLNSTYWWRCRLGDSNGNLTEWTSPQTFGYQEAPFDLVAAAMFIFPIVLMIIAFAFDNVVFASFAGIVFIISGLFFVDVIWLAMIFVGIGIYLLIAAFLSEED